MRRFKTTSGVSTILILAQLTVLCLAPRSCQAQDRDREATLIWGQAFQNFRQKNYAEAEAGYRLSASISPTTIRTANANFWIGKCRFEQQKYQEAVMFFTAAYKQFPQPETLKWRAKSYFEAGDNLNAIKDLDTVITISRYRSQRADASILYERGRVLAAMQEWPSAYQDFGVAAAIEPSNQQFQQARDAYREYLSAQGGVQRLGLVNERISFYRYYIDPPEGRPSSVPLDKANSESLKSYSTAIYDTREKYIDRATKGAQAIVDRYKNEDWARIYKQKYAEAQQKYEAARRSSSVDDVETDSRSQDMKRYADDMEYYEKKYQEALRESENREDDSQSIKSANDRWEEEQQREMRRKEWEQRDELMRLFQFKRKPEYEDHG